MVELCTITGGRLHHTWLISLSARESWRVGSTLTSHRESGDDVWLNGLLTSHSRPSTCHLRTRFLLSVYLHLTLRRWVIGGWKLIHWWLAEFARWMHAVSPIATNWWALWVALYFGVRPYTCYCSWPLLQSATHHADLIIRVIHTDHALSGQLLNGAAT